MAEPPDASAAVVQAPRTADRIGQGTAIEQSRATAEVLGSIEAAQRWPRDTQAARHELHIVCGMMSVAEHAFYSYPQAGELIEGSTVYLARYMALAWGHVHFGINELRRDDDYGQSEVMSWAWDVQKGVRSSRVFILPHYNYTASRKDGKRPRKLLDLREIQFNNLSVAGRNVRETMFAVMPAWFKEEAEILCRKTLLEGELLPDGKTRKKLAPLPIRIGNLIALFDEHYRVTEGQLEKQVGKHRDRWTLLDVLGLERVGRCIKTGELTVAGVFPPPVTTSAEIISAAPPRPPEQATKDTAHPAGQGKQSVQGDPNVSSSDDPDQQTGT